MYIAIIAVVILTACKLVGVLKWAWIWITSPLWIPVAIAAGCLGIAMIGAAVIQGTLIAFRSPGDPQPKEAVA